MTTAPIFPDISLNYNLIEIPMFSTLLVTFSNSRIEQRKALQNGVRWGFKCSWTALSIQEKETIQQFFLARKGNFESFFFYHPQPSQVIGTDGLNYTCKLTNLASLDNKPITGASYADCWQQEGNNGVIWNIGNIYRYGFIVRFKEGISTYVAFNFNLWENNEVELLECDILNANATTIYTSNYITTISGT